MSVSDDFLAGIADDYIYTDAVQDITYTATRAQGGTPVTTAFPVTNADPQDFDLDEIANSGGFFKAGDRRWFLGADQFPPGITPQRGDTITQADSTVWSIIAKPQLDGFGISWGCPSRQDR